jgi:hypothetical protein
MTLLNEPAIGDPPRLGLRVKLGPQGRAARSRVGPWAWYLGERYRAEMEEYRKRIKAIPVKTPANSVKVKKTPCEKKVTAFDNYMKSKKNKVKEKHPDIEEVELIQVLKNKWKKLPLNKRAKYIKSV